MLKMHFQPKWAESTLLLFLGQILGHFPPQGQVNNTCFLSFSDISSYSLLYKHIDPTFFWQKKSVQFRHLHLPHFDLLLGIYNSPWCNFLSIHFSRWLRMSSKRFASKWVCTSRKPSGNTSFLLSLVKVS